MNDESAIEYPTHYCESCDVRLLPNEVLLDRVAVRGAEVEIVFHDRAGEACGLVRPITADVRRPPPRCFGYLGDIVAPADRAWQWTLRRSRILEPMYEYVLVATDQEESP